ncbi:2-oxo-hepta-3-ene-1,7-dioic acid hydratase [Aureimonas fodinaquatilis]|uniref:2-oxo-hepta-3-ene-1,7-dioic acid hydratase n=1 Tax=Aureimonas fodinaquatilis TaxID=2565783 RepID=A0A5B0DUY9_9HYPH|nr:2-oxo-hepta-3-ene-1,7-dioic acid hydratase [Aureimonas fodinaquatilis]KAA0969765.1 2-oxo-hepta-3-ene-1,7-dioic acid hydratase [Aureimonas fodinaquatilis]
MKRPGWIEDAADRLDRAEKYRTQTGLLSLANPEMSMDDAYAVQSAWIKRKLATGETTIGWKIGLTSRAMQQALNIDVPDSGVLLDSMWFEDGSTIPARRFIQPRVEAEIAFVMKKPLSGLNLSIDAVLDATDYVAPALEILDTRIVRADAATGRMRNFCDTIADNAANAGIVLGKHRADPETLDLRWIGAIVSRDGVIEETGLGAGVLGHPATSVSWLAARLTQYGHQIEPGQIILSGSFIRPIECPLGTDIHADFGQFGTVGCHFAKED